MNIQHKLKVLSNIANTLNKNNVTWALGASTLLYFNNIVDNFNDIDIIITEDDINKTTELLSQIATRQHRDNNPNFISEAFLEFNIENIDIDIIAGFRIIENNNVYYFPLEKAHINYNNFVNDICVPLHSLEQWKKYYTLMGRKHKADLIDISKHTKQ